MPRGRHRHSPPLHRLLPPSALAGVSVICALGPWVFAGATAVRALAAAAAVTAVAGAVVMRRWDTQAGRQVAELTRARAGDEWRYEERVAELETDLEESRELRVKLEQRLRAKRAELAGLRNEHAALLRRYATAETERASALEGRRLLEIETVPPGPAPSSSPALPPGRSVRAGAEREAAGPAAVGTAADTAPPCPVFSPEGARLYRRALTALARFDRRTPDAPAGTGAGPASEGGPEPEPDPEAAPAPEAGTPAPETTAPAPEAGAPDTGSVVPDTRPAARGTGAAAAAVAAVDAAPEVPAGEAHPVGEPAGAVRPAGHFTVPTAVAVAPAAPARRHAAEGGFDFFGTQKGAPKAALDSVQNEDLADVVGQEALAVHKAEAEAGFKPADARSRGVGQVIDLTAHDETEQIDVQRLRGAAS
ncbi:hypothetical protein ACIQVT_29055 [Streptomyces sp. NPDC100445]|uniref:hypothetical protein n=1 Tax=Streptomyces sp. NPDC100445 TaxID=3366102 RepID=UPI003826AE97